MQNTGAAERLKALDQTIAKTRSELDEATARAAQVEAAYQQAVAEAAATGAGVSDVSDSDCEEAEAHQRGIARRLAAMQAARGALEREVRREELAHLEQALIESQAGHRDATARLIEAQRELARAVSDITAQRCAHIALGDRYGRLHQMEHGGGPVCHANLEPRLRWASPWEPLARLFGIEDYMQTGPQLGRAWPWEKEIPQDFPEPHPAAKPRPAVAKPAQSEEPAAEATAQDSDPEEGGDHFSQAMRFAREWRGLQ